MRRISILFISTSCTRSKLMMGKCYTGPLLYIAFFLSQAGAFLHKITVPVHQISKPDTYMCLKTKTDIIPNGSLVGFEIECLSGSAHHVSLTMCEHYNFNETLWDCSHTDGRICRGRTVSLGGIDDSTINHASIMFPNDVGIQFGPAEKLNFLSLQVHFQHPLSEDELEFPPVNLTLHIQKERRPYSLQQLLLGSTGYIPPLTTFSSEIVMTWTRKPVQALAFNIHTHSHGMFGEGYLIKGNTTKPVLIGKELVNAHRNPIFELDDRLLIETGDTIAARCVFRNNENRTVEFGMTHQDEMCNFGINFMFEAQEAAEFSQIIMEFQSAQEKVWCKTENLPRELCEISAQVE